MVGRWEIKHLHGVTIGPIMRDAPPIRSDVEVDGTVPNGAVRHQGVRMVHVLLF